MGDSPYSDQPDYAFWRRAITEIEPGAVDPVARADFKLAADCQIVTSGSCFSQAIGRYIGAAGLNFMNCEPGHKLFPALLSQEHGYGVFSTRSGNIYTPRQLVQLFDRAYGDFKPTEDVWRSPEGAWIDPFRPQIEPGGFRCERAYWLDRSEHLAAVRRMFETLDVFVFTLGLTECWSNRDDGAVYPLCPGVVGGTFHPERYELLTLGVDETVADLHAFYDRLARVNPHARAILTVSPVPMQATALDRHVLVSNTFSKSVLRVAAGMVCDARETVSYFPSYEIITGPQARGQYYNDDTRTVAREGVERVMRVFFRHYFDLIPDFSRAEPTRPAVEAHIAELDRLADLLCDEDALDPGATR
ncbi:MAG: GSCFA domain-containing protein [Roseovarius sp.]